MTSSEMQNPSCEVHASAGKVKLVWIKDYPRAGHPYQKVNHAQPMCIVHPDHYHSA